MKTTLKVILLLCALFPFACSSTPKEKKEITSVKQEGLSEVEIGSALSKDRQKRLNFLTQTIKEKNRKLKEVEKSSPMADSQAALEIEILANEVLLLEAEKFGLEDGLDLKDADSL